MLGQIRQQGIDLVKTGAVDQVAAAGFASDQPRMGQFLQVERQRAGRHAQLGGNGASGQPVGPATTGPEGPQPLAWARGGERAQGGGASSRTAAFIFQ